MTQRRDIHAALERQRQQCGLGRVAQRTPARFRHVRRRQLGVVAQRDRFEQGTQGGIVLRRDLTRRSSQHPLRRVARAADRERTPIRQPHVSDRHFITGKRAGLVGTDDIGRAQGLHRRKLPHDGTACRHALHADRQRDGERHRQPLRYDGHHLADRHHENLAQRKPAHQAEAHHGNEQHHCRARQITAKLGQSKLQRRPGSLGRGRHTSNPADLGIEPGSNHHRLAPPSHDVRARIQHIPAVAQKGVGREHVRMFVYRQRFTGQRSLGQLQCRVRYQARVGAHGIAGRQQQDIARNQPDRPDHLFLPVAQHPHIERRQPAQRRHRARGPVFMQGPDQRIDQHHGQDDQRIPLLAQCKGKRRRRQQDIDEGALELGQDHAPGRAAHLFRQGIFPALRKPFHRILGAQSLRGRYFQDRQNIHCRTGMPAGLKLKWSRTCLLHGAFSRKVQAGHALNALHVAAPRLPA
ncbi:hypothetical protein GALL_409160 [mine drainage metagenome]|uniref:Uncharacterized protein n=1 Tax=mine drainage metagenome TaxID=410659 RepID=A0A1J5QN03_9ZZZZ